MFARAAVLTDIEGTTTPAAFIKRAPDTYVRLAIGMNVPTAGMRPCQIVRDGTGTVASGRHPVADTFAAASAIRGLPRV